MCMLAYSLDLDFLIGVLCQQDQFQNNMLVSGDIVTMYLCCVYVKLFICTRQVLMKYSYISVMLNKVLYLKPRTVHGMPFVYSA